MKIETIDIVGLGALGVMYADLFTEKLGKDRVRVLADGARIRRYGEKPVTFNGKVCDFAYRDAAMESRPAASVVCREIRRVRGSHGRSGPSGG